MLQRFLFTSLAAAVAFFALGQVAARADLLTGLKSYYNFNESTGSTLPLSGGTGNAGVLNNMTNADWVASQPGYGNALDFDGVNDYVQIPDGYTNTVSGDNTHTFAVWVNPRSVTNSPVVLDASVGYYTYFMELGTGSTKAYNAVGTNYRTYAGTPLSLNTWHQLIFTKTGTGDSGELYIDGVHVVSYTGNTTSALTQSSDFLLARFKNAGFEFNGLIDDLAFWDRDLTETEITQLYSLGFQLDNLVNPPPPAPEPSSMLMFAIGGLGLVRHTHQRKQQ